MIDPPEIDPASPDHRGPAPVAFSVVVGRDGSWVLLFTPQSGNLTWVNLQLVPIDPKGPSGPD